MVNFAFRIPFSHALVKHCPNGIAAMELPQWNCRNGIVNHSVHLANAKPNVR